MNRTLIVLLCGLLLLWGSCSNNPTGPGIGQAPILYVVTYPFVSGTLRIMCIDTEVDSVIDSIILPEGPEGIMAALGVSPDGARLYLDNAVVDTRSKAFIPGALTGVPTPDGRHLIYSNVDTFRVIDSRRNEIVFQTDSLPFVLDRTNFSDNFDAERGLIYGALYNEARSMSDKIVAFDYCNLQVAKVLTPAEIGGYDIVVGDIALTSDGETLFYTSACWSPVFTCIDLGSERVVCTYGINGTNSLGIAPNDEYVYITDPGCYIFEPPPLGLIQVYVPAQGIFGTPIDVATVANVCDSIVSFFPLTDQIVIPPNGRKAYVSTYDARDILVIDVATQSIRKVLCDVGWTLNLTMKQD